MRHRLWTGTAGVLAFASVAWAAQGPPAPAAPAGANDYTLESSWLCRPGRGDACAIDLTTTVVHADGTLVGEAWRAQADAPIDCFYVYPTISTDPGPTSDMTPDPAEHNVIAQQFARFASVCRPFAPLYRQVTLAGLRQLSGDLATSLGQGPGYADVRDAWRDYLARDNRGRGVVLIGHSQGAYVLIELLKNEIEGTPAQARLVSAILMGTTVSVPRGDGGGGTFRTLAPCRAAGDTGCVISFSTYRDRVPPPSTARFGRRVEGRDAVCTNPVTFGADAGELHAYLSASGRTIVSQARPAPWVTGRTVDTPWVSVPGLLTARCVSNAHATYLEIAVKADPADPRVDDITGDLGPPGKPLADWGLHLVDVNLAMGNLLSIVERQGRAWTARRP
jgi:hypothetical protein